MKNNSKTSTKNNGNNMNIDYVRNNYEFETLNSNHDLSHFKCYSKDLTDFLQNDALELQKSKLSVTTLVVCDGEIIGYFSLLTDTIPIKNINEDNIRLDIKKQLNVTSKNKLLPAVKIGRLAIDEKYSGSGIGTEVLINILYNIKKTAETEIGLRYVVVEAYAKALNFYVEHNNFNSLERDSKKIEEKLDIIVERNPTKTFYLYLDLTTLE